MVRNWCLWVAFGGCSRAGSAAALRIPFGVDQECSGASGTSQCQERLLGAGLAGSQREIRVTRAHDPMAAGAPSFHPPALSIPSWHPNLQRDVREDRRDLGAAAATANSTSPVLPSRVRLFPAPGIASMALSRCLNQHLLSSPVARELKSLDVLPEGWE